MTIKNKMIMLALAATISLGACGYSGEHRGYSTMDHKQAAYKVSGEELSRKDVRKVQRSLAAQGFYKGRADGIWGKKTSQAILDYQTAHRHEATGMMNTETLQEFGVRMHHRSKY